MLLMFGLLMFAAFILFCIGMAAATGWHNYHCRPPRDYKEGVRKAWSGRN